MANGNEIIVSAHPRGHFEEIIVSGTPKPGTCLSPTTAARVGGRRTMEPAGTTASLGMGADGDLIPVCVLLPDHLQGKGPTDALVAGQRAMVYYPIAGEELNVLFQNNTGTADDIAVGDKLMIDDGTGKILKSAGPPASEPFVAMEAIVDPTADQLLHVSYSGH
jgi:hypothetical protein